MGATKGSRSYSIPDLKKLFALSRNVCAYPTCEVQLADPNWPYVQCEIAHIYGLSPGGPRYIGEMSDGDRNSYENLMLFCRNHHQLVDYLEPQNYPADLLLDMKWAHENRGSIGVSWCPEALLDEYVRKLAVTLNIVVADGQREPIRSSRPAPEAEAQVVRDRSGEPRSVRRKSIRVHELASELGMSSHAMVELCETLGIPIKSASSSLNEAYADMARRRAQREGLTRSATNANAL